MDNIVIFKSNDRQEMFMEVPVDYSNLNIGDEIRYTMTDEQRKEVELFYSWDDLFGKIESKKVDISKGVIYWSVNVFCHKKDISCIDCKNSSISKYLSPCYGCYDNGEYTNFVKSENKY